MAVAPPSSAQESETFIVTADAAGPIRLGATVEQLRQDLGDNFEVGEQLSIAEDLDGYAVTRGTVIFAFVATGQDPASAIELIIAANPNFATAEGIGPRSLVADAVAAYGEPALSWDPDDQGREVVTFGEGPAGLAFYTSDSGGPRAGVYADDSLTTTVVKPEATISTVWIDCRQRPCPNSSSAAVADEPAETEEAPAPAEEAPTNEEPTNEEPTNEEPEESVDNSVGPDPAALPNTGSESAPLAATGFLLLGYGTYVLGLKRLT